MKINRKPLKMICALLAISVSGCSCESNFDEVGALESTVNSCSTDSSNDISQITISDSIKESEDSPSYTVEDSNVISGSRYIAAENAARIVTSIDRKNIYALVNVYLIDFTLDGFPELVISYDTASGHSFVENEVYDLQSENLESIFSFRSSGISRDYEDSIFLCTNSENEKFYAFIYGMNSENYLTLDYVDKLFCQNNEYQVKNIFSSTVSSDNTLYNNEFLYNGNPIDEISFEKEKSEWFSDLQQQTFNYIQIPIEADEWDNIDVLEEIFSKALSDEKTDFDENSGNYKNKTLADVTGDNPYTEYSSDDELFCRSYPGVCKAFENISSDNNADNSVETAISRLMDKNLICIYTYFTTALFQTQNPAAGVDEDGYYQIDFRFFDNLSEFYQIVQSTYTEPISNKLIQGYINPDEPTFLERNGTVMYNPNYTDFTVGPYFSELGYKIEITEQSDSLCKFLYTPLYETLSNEEYNELAECWGNDMLPHECEAVFENGEWKLNDIVFAF